MRFQIAGTTALIAVSLLLVYLARLPAQLENEAHVKRLLSLPFHPVRAPFQELSADSTVLSIYRSEPYTLFELGSARVAFLGKTHFSLPGNPSRSPMLLWGVRVVPLARTPNIDVKLPRAKAVLFISAESVQILGQEMPIFSVHRNLVVVSEDGRVIASRSGFDA